MKGNEKKKEKKNMKRKTEFYLDYEFQSALSID